MQASKYVYQPYFCWDYLGLKKVSLWVLQRFTFPSHFWMKLARVDNWDRHGPVCNVHFQAADTAVSGLLDNSSELIIISSWVYFSRNYSFFWFNREWFKCYEMQCISKFIASFQVILWNSVCTSWGWGWAPTCVSWCVELLNPVFIRKQYLAWCWAS